MKQKIRILIVLTIITGYFSLTRHLSSKTIVRIYTALEDYRIPAYQKLIEDAYPNVEVHITRLSSGKLAAKVLAEGSSCEADIILATPANHLYGLKEAGLLEKYDTNLTFASGMEDSDSMVIPSAAISEVIIVNTQELKNNNLPEPTSFADLANPIYKGYIAMASPKSSGTAYAIYVGLLNYFGEEEAFNYYDKLIGNLKMMTESGSAPTQMVTSGEVAISLGMDFEGFDAIKEGKPVKVIFPTEGSPYYFDGHALLKKNHEIKSEVMDVMNLIVSNRAYEVAQSQAYIPVLSGREIIADQYPDNFKLMDMSNMDSVSFKTKMLEKWGKRYE